MTGTYPDGPPPLDELWGWYLDSECSLLCQECAEESNHWDEVPHFRPVTEVRNLGADEYCDQCSRMPDADETA